MWICGDTYRVKLTGCDTDHALGLVEGSVPPGAGPGPHIHAREDETFYILSGRLDIEADGHTLVGKPGDLVFVPRGTVHRFINRGTHPARLLFFYTPAGFEQFFLDVGVPAAVGQTPPQRTRDEHARIARRALDYGWLSGETAEPNRPTRPAHNQVAAS